MDQKLIIYQMLPRIFANRNTTRRPWGTLSDNGCGKLNDIDTAALKAIRDLGANAVWYTGIIEHATKSDFTAFGIEADNPWVVKGEAGSPYAISDYYDVAPALATHPDRRMEEFENLVHRTHNAGLKCIIDFVPNHTARRYHSDAAPSGIEDFGAHDNTDYFFSPSNDYYYIPRQRFSPSIPLGAGADAYYEFPAKATGNDCFSAFPGEYDWYETVKLNYGRDYGDGSTHFDPAPPVWLKMLSILRFWASKGIDGFRCDMVFMVPLEFWHWAIPRVKKDWPHIIFIGEIYDTGLYRRFLDYGCFDYLYDKVNLYDTLFGIERHGVSAARLTAAWQTVDGIGDRMLNFLENHDEVRYASEAFAGNPHRVLPALVAAATMHRGPFLIYYAQELGEPAADNEGFAGHNCRTSIFDYWSLDTLCRQAEGKLSREELRLRDLYRTVLRLCNSEAAIARGGFFDLMYANLDNPGVHPHSQFIYLRHYRDEVLLIALNFADAPADISVRLPQEAFEAASLPFGRTEWIDLLGNSRLVADLDASTPFRTHVGARGAAIWKFSPVTKKIEPVNAAIPKS